MAIPLAQRGFTTFDALAIFELPGRTARALPVRRSRGDAADGRTGVLGIDRSPEITTVTPADAGVVKIGHKGFLKPEHRDALWRGMAEWLEAEWEAPSLRASGSREC